VPDPVLHLLAGPNGAGKTTFYERVLGPSTYLEFVNADVIAASRWPDDPMTHAYEAARLAAEERARLLEARRSFVTETVFSHESKVSLVEAAGLAGYLVTLHIILVPEDLAVARVAQRALHGGHDVPEAKVRARFHRLWQHVRAAVALVDEARVYDNTKARTPYDLRAAGT
jgi:predicted ABC-type ATPase